MILTCAEHQVFSLGLICSMTSFTRCASRSLISMVRLKSFRVQPPRLDLALNQHVVARVDIFVERRRICFTLKGVRKPSLMPSFSGYT